MFGSVKENALDFVVIDDEMLYEEWWFEHPNLSCSTPSNFSDAYMRYLNPSLCHRNFEDETEMKPLEISPLCYPLKDAFFGDQTPKKRLIQAIEYLKESTRDVDVLIQIWLPVFRSGKRVLTTDNQPFILNLDSINLSNYREISKSYQFATEENSEELLGLPGRVFLKKFPTCTSDFQFLGEEADDPRINYAQKFNLCGSLNLPVFEQGSGTCLGVIEIVTTSQKVNYRDELETICIALEAVDLRSSEFLIHPKEEDCNEPYKMALAEIRDVLKSVCDIHRLPLAQTWGPCNGGCWQQSGDGISVLDSASYVFDPQVLGFYEACSQQQLVRGEGIAGKALGTNQPCFATDITAFCRTEYPLADHARMFGLSGAVAIRLRSTYTGLIDFVLEFFLPRDCKNDEEQGQMRSSISSVIQCVSRSLRVTTNEELAEEASSPAKEPAPHESSWISHLLEAQQRGESVIVSMGCQKEEPEEEFKVINQWNYPEIEFCHGPSFSDPEKKNLLDSGTKGRSRSSGTRQLGEKRRVKTERNISLQVLRQYFPGSLKDAAKSIGVCPTTLKRICRQHGIMRWPSRKIKKVGHSLKKLQLVIDSVQGVEGTIQLGSFYTNFPELSSPISPTPKSKVNDRVNILKSQTTASNSSSSCSHSSGSSLCCSTGNAVYTEIPGGSLQRPCSNTPFIKDFPQEERKSVVRSPSDKSVDDHHSPEVLPPVLKRSSPALQEEGSFRVKATYGEEKIRLRISQLWGFGDLQQEVRRRFNIDDMGNITLKYFDDDSEWVLLTCDADLEECMDLHKSSKNRTIKLFLQQSSHPELGSSFTGSAQSS